MYSSVGKPASSMAVLQAVWTMSLTSWRNSASELCTLLSWSVSAWMNCGHGGQAASLAGRTVEVGRRSRVDICPYYRREELVGGVAINENRN